MTFLTRKALTRRTMLKGMGASVALPLLDSMMPALSAQSRQAPMRLGFVYAAHGVIHSEWKPRQTGRQYELPPNLQPLEGVRDHFNVLTNLSHLEADSKGDGSGDHNRAAGAWLTGVHAYDRTRPGAEIRLATSADQIAAKHLGKDSRVPSIEMTLDPATQGACDSGDCFYVNTVSWRSETSPNMPEIHPRVIFERLFGDGGSAEQRRARIRKAGQHPRFGAGGNPFADRDARPLGHLQAGRVPGFGPRSRAAHSERGIQPRGIDRAARPSHRHSRQLRGLRPAHVRPAAAGVPQRHHARVLADHGARAERALLQPNRRAGQPSPDLASS